jgi:hypothetical protein
MLGDRIGQPAEPDEADYRNPGELGELLGGLSGQAANRLLITAGLQIEQRTADGKFHDKWLLTEAGLAYGHAFGKHIAKNGYQTRHVRWLPSVVEILKPLLSV